MHQFRFILYLEKLRLNFNVLYKSAVLITRRRADAALVCDSCNPALLINNIHISKYTHMQIHFKMCFLKTAHSLLYSLLIIKNANIYHCRRCRIFFFKSRQWNYNYLKTIFCSRFKNKLGLEIKIREGRKLKRRGNFCCDFKHEKYMHDFPCSC